MAALESAVVIPCRDESLIGIVHPGANKASLGVVFLVGGDQYRVGAHRQYRRWAHVLAEAGFPSLRFDYRGQGDSTGEPRDFTDLGEDIEAAVNYFMNTRPDLNGVVLLGLCDGASAALLHVDRVKSMLYGLCLINPWVHTEVLREQAEVKHYYVQRLASKAFWKKFLQFDVRVFDALAEFFHKLRRTLSACYSLAGARQDGFQAAMLTGLNNADVPVLIALSADDLTGQEFSLLSQSAPLWGQALRKDSVEQVLIEAADHTFSTAVSQERIESVLLDWFQRRFS